jgi:tetratricopeptide (TPR) repeat protein
LPQSNALRILSEKDFWGDGLTKGQDPDADPAILGQKLAKQPGDLAARIAYAEALETAGQRQEAIETLALGAEFHPGDPDLAARLGRMLTEQERHGDAQQILSAGLAACPTHLELRGLLAAELAADRQIPAALTHLKILVAIIPDQSGIYVNLGVLLQAQNRIEPAIACYRKAVAIDEENHLAHVNLAAALLTLGRLRDGFLHYEHRLFLADVRQPPEGLAAWRGEDPAGKSFLVTGEQGFGDMVQFVRFLPLLSSRGGQIWLECPEELRRLFLALPGLEGIVCPGDDLPQTDYAVPLLSLPHFLGCSSFETVPTTPYITAPVSGALLPAEKRPKIGLVWGGRQPAGELFVRRMLGRRSCRLQDLAPLWRQSDFAWYSLQVGEAAQQIGVAADHIVDLADQIGDFADCAALMTELDLIISVDTASAHLAAALGRRVWVLLSQGQVDYRWAGADMTSPWYPKARLFQASEGGWADLAAALALVLRGQKNLLLSS